MPIPRIIIKILNLLRILRIYYIHPYIAIIKTMLGLARGYFLVLLLLQMPIIMGKIDLRIPQSQSKIAKKQQTTPTRQSNSIRQPSIASRLLSA